MLKTLLYLAIGALLIVVLYIGLNLLSSTKESTISETLEKNLEPIEPTFNIEAINRLKERPEVNVDLSDSTIVEASETTSTQSALQASPTIVQPAPSQL